MVGSAHHMGGYLDAVGPEQLAVGLIEVIRALVQGVSHIHLDGAPKLARLTRRVHDLDTLTGESVHHVGDRLLCAHDRNLRDDLLAQAHVAFLEWHQVALIVVEHEHGRSEAVENRAVYAGLSGLEQPGEDCVTGGLDRIETLQTVELGRPLVGLLCGLRNIDRRLLAQAPAKRLQHAVDDSHVERRPPRRVGGSRVLVGVPQTLGQEAQDGDLECQGRAPVEVVVTHRCRQSACRGRRRWTP